MTLAEIKAGQIVRIVGLLGDDISKRRLMSLGIVRGKEISLETMAPMGDPKIYSILGYRLSIRNDDANNILVSAS
ncbi:MAG: ferrous iron transport protein A [Magnetococcales bacterium]|nr:ferrous iron transport protein A [Magnetococcales bacterium]